MDQLRDGLQRRIVNFAMTKHYLEGAKAALMSELAFEHVEANLARSMCIPVRINETKSCGRIDKSADQPSGPNAIDFDAPPGDPSSAVQRFQIRLANGTRRGLHSAVDLFHD